MFNFKGTIAEAAKIYSPAMIANYVYELAKQFNQFYHDYPIFKEENNEIKEARIALSNFVGITIKNGMKILGINVPEKM